MNKEIETVRQKLDDGEYTCVVMKDGEEYTSRERGVKPLLTLLESERSFIGAIAADKTVGAGAAHLYVLLGVKALWANVISTSALRVLEQNGIEAYYKECVPYIINRQGNGACPIETAVKDAKNSKDAFELIIEALNELGKKPNGEK